MRTIIPATAVAEFDFRLVPEVTAEDILRAFAQHIEDQGFYLVDSKPTQAERESHSKLASLNSHIAYTAFRTDLDSSVGDWLRSALTNAFDEPPIQIRMFGGSVPISPFVTTLDIPAVIVPTVNPDNNQHSPNENIRLGNFDNAIRSFLAILVEPIPE